MGGRFRQCLDLIEVEGAMQASQVDIYQEDRDKTLYEFVNSLFDFARDPKRSGLFIEMESGNNTHIEIRPIDDSHIVILMDGCKMGTFEAMNGQGYKCCFFQAYRPKIKTEPTENEQMMKSICEHKLVKFIEA